MRKHDHKMNTEGFFSQKLFGGHPDREFELPPLLHIVTCVLQGETSPTRQYAVPINCTMCPTGRDFSH